MRRDPQKLAWTILYIAFTLFCLLAVIIPLSIRRYIINATNAHEATLEVIEGTVLVETGTGIIPQNPRISEGDSIQTDSTSRGRLTLFDDSTITLFPETEITILAMRSPRFWLSPQPNRIVMEERGGRTRIRVAESFTSSLHFELHSPQLVALLERGSYSLKATNERSEIAVSDGKALVRAAGREVVLERGERTVVPIGQPPAPPMPAARDLIVNGNFGEPLSEGWEVYDDQGGDGGDIGGTAEVIALGDRRAVHFYRTGGEGNHYTIGVRQRIDEDISDSTSLILRLEARILFQGLSGGGYQSSEYPIIVRIHYRDVYKSESFWIHGFYYHDDGTYPTLSGEQIPQDLWYPYEKVDLLEVMSPRPYHIDSIHIYASGWDYESMISGVELITE